MQSAYKVLKDKKKRKAKSPAALWDKDPPTMPLNLFYVGYLQVGSTLKRGLFLQ